MAYKPHANKNQTNAHTKIHLKNVLRTAITPQIISSQNGVPLKTQKKLDLMRVGQDQGIEDPLEYFNSCHLSKCLRVWDIRHSLTGFLPSFANFKRCDFLKSLEIAFVLK